MKYGGNLTWTQYIKGIEKGGASENRAVLRDHQELIEGGKASGSLELEVVKPGRMKHTPPLKSFCLVWASTKCHQCLHPLSLSSLFLSSNHTQETMGNRSFRLEGTPLFALFSIPEPVCSRCSSNLPQIKGILRLGTLAESGGAHELESKPNRCLPCCLLTFHLQLQEMSQKTNCTLAITKTYLGLVITTGNVKKSFSTTIPHIVGLWYNSMYSFFLRIELYY